VNFDEHINVFNIPNSLINIHFTDNKLLGTHEKYTNMLKPLKDQLVITIHDNKNWKIKSNHYFINWNKMSKQIKVINYIETMRVFTCPYCWNSNHTLRKCYHFIQYKNITSKYSYCQNILEPNDALGYCAGGIIICSKNKFLMLNEIRKGENKLNFIGGGRETVIDIKNRKYMEKPHQTIINELTEELNEIYSDNDNNIHVDNSKWGKYVEFMDDFEGEGDRFFWILLKHKQFFVFSPLLFLKNAI